MEWPLGCRGVLVFTGALLLIAVIPFARGSMDRKPAQSVKTESKPEQPNRPAPIQPLATSFAPCPFPQFPSTGWKDPISGGFFVPHAMSWNAGVRNANEGMTRFVMSGKMHGRLFDAHFSMRGSAWKAVIDDYLP
ncbi:MAG: hypothetical protein R6V62_08145 [Candidatus Fermentibacteraceae bacterium]